MGAFFLFDFCPANEIMQSLHKVVSEFIADPDDPHHEYLRVMAGARVGEPMRLYILASGLGKLSKYMAESAQYLMYVDITDTTWPNGPPKGFFLTENGVFDVGKNICTSNGVYHPDQYVTMPLIAHMYSMLLAMVMNDKMLHHGIGVRTYDKKRGVAIRAASQASAEYNKNFPIIAEIISFSDEYRARFPRLPEGAAPPEWARGKTEYIRLPLGMYGDHAEKSVVVYGNVDEFPALHKTWKICRIIKGGNCTPPPSMIVIDERDELGDLGL